MKDIPEELQREVDRIGAVLVDEIPIGSLSEYQYIIFGYGKYLRLDKSMEVPWSLYTALSAALRKLGAKSDFEG